MTTIPVQAAWNSALGYGYIDNEGNFVPISLGSVSPSATVTGPDSFGGSSTPGVSAAYSRGDHDHGLPAAPSVPGASATVSGPPAFGSASNAGTSGAFSRGDHAHGLPANPAPSAASSVTGPDSFGAPAVVGSSSNYARQDHDHGLPSAPSVGTSNTSALLYSVTPNSPSDGGNYATIQAAVNAIEAGTIPYGSIILVSPAVGTQTSVTIQPSGSNAKNGMSVICLDRAPNQDATKPTIGTLTVTSASAKTENIYIWGFTINAEVWYGGGSVITDCDVEQCSYVASGGTTGIYFNQHSSGIQYCYHFNCTGADRNVTSNSNIPFIDITGSQSSTGHLDFIKFRHTTSSSGAYTGVFLQIENGTNVNPSINLPLVDFVQESNYAYVMFNAVGGTSSTTANAVFGPSGYIEGGGLSGNVRPITLMQVGSFTGGASFSGGCKFQDISYNAAYSSGGGVSITAFNISNTSWGGNPATFTVEGGELRSGGTSVFAAGTTGTFSGSYYCRIERLKGWNGFIGNSATPISVPSTGNAAVNSNPYKITLHFLTASSATYKITDLNGVNSPSIPCVAGGHEHLPPGWSITPTYSALTWTTTETDL